MTKAEKIVPNLKMSTVREIEARCLACLTLASDAAAPTITTKTSWLEHPAQPYHGLAGWGYGTSPAQQYPLSPHPFSAAQAAELFAGMQALDEPSRAKLTLAIDRLRRSRLHEEPVDRAIDLGIALEIVLLGEERQELRYRASLNAALYLETDPVKRRDVVKKVRDAYDARSMAVHVGIIGSKQAAALAPADEIFRRVAIKIINERRIPKWEDVVLAAI